jgi:hypothetical protein
LLTIQNPALFDGSLLSANAYSITVKLTCAINGNSLCFSNIYGPAAVFERVVFINWLYSFDTSEFDDWLLAGDFNLIRSLANRNKDSGNQQDMLLFNDLIQHLDLAEIEFRGKDFTWSNMQQDPSLKNLIGFLLPLSGLPLTLTLLLKC